MGKFYIQPYWVIIGSMKCIIIIIIIIKISGDHPAIHIVVLEETYLVKTIFYPLPHIMLRKMDENFLSYIFPLCSCLT
jgi:hypothetical protein